MTLKFWLVFLLFFLFLSSLSASLSLFEKEPVVFTSAQRKASITDIRFSSLATFNIPNAHVDRCFTMQEEMRTGGAAGLQKVFNLEFDSTCEVCGEFSIRFYEPTKQKNFTKALHIPCEADVLLVGRAGISVPSPSSPGFKEYVKYAKEEGFTVKVASIGLKKELSQVNPGPSGFHLAARVTGTIISPVMVQGVTVIKGGLIISGGSVMEGIRSLRAVVKPRYILLLGTHSAIPMRKYEMKTPPKDEYTETFYYSDHAYGTTGEDSEGKLVVSVSRIPLDTYEKIDDFLLRATRFPEVSETPAILTIRDASSPFIETRTTQLILPYYHSSRVNQCTSANKCFYGPPVCARQGCNTALFPNFLKQSRHLIFQTHGNSAELEGPEVVGPNGELTGTYQLLAKGEDFAGGLQAIFSQTPLEGAFVHFASCRALYPIDEETTELIPNLLYFKLLGEAGVVGMFGRSGKSSSFDLFGKRGQFVRVGDELVRLKGLSRKRDQEIKLSYYGNPLLRVKV